jgi:hypothetical protein
LSLGRIHYRNFDSSVLDDMFDDEQPKTMKESVPILENGWGQHGPYQLVGQGSVTNDNCGRFRSYYGCLRPHDVIAPDGKSYKGKVYVHRVNHSCDKPSCPICFKYGWAPKEAGRIETRLKEASKRFGLVEHIVATVPPKFYGLEFESLRAKIVEVLFARGVIGGVLIFHGFRYNLRKYWYWSPHFHVLGFILGGYKCRGCARCVRGCGDFVDKSYRCFEKDGCVVRVLGKRKTVGGTAWYQLNHATLKVGSPRFHVATWFGVCSYRKLKVTLEKRKSLCPICGFDLVKLRYNGNRFVKDENLTSGKRSFFADAVDECGFPVWVADKNARCSG